LVDIKIKVIYVVFIEKAKPAVRRGRKATGLIKTAGLPDIGATRLFFSLFAFEVFNMKTLREQWNTGDRTLKQAASELGVHWRTVYRWTLMGVISFIQYRTNGPIFIPQTEIERLKKRKKALPG
jgi:hypothetical protein